MHKDIAAMGKMIPKGMAPKKVTVKTKMVMKGPKKTSGSK
jgi:hypothetical protein